MSLSIYIYIASVFGTKYTLRQNMWDLCMPCETISAYARHTKRRVPMQGGAIAAQFLAMRTIAWR